MFSTSTSLIISPAHHTEGMKLSANVGFGSILSFFPSPSVSGFLGSVPSSFSAVSGRPSPSVSREVLLVTVATGVFVIVAHTGVFVVL